MKTPLFLTGLALSAINGFATPVAQTTAIQTRPDPAAPTVGYLKAGSEPAPAPPDGSAGTPAGWMAVSLPGPFTGYVQNADLTKALNVKPGSSVYLEPRTDSGVLLVAGPGDTLEITGLRGKWTQVQSGKPLIGYIRTGSDLAGAQSSEVAAGESGVSPAAPAALAEPTNAPGKPATVTSEAGAAGGIPRALEGKFASAQRRFLWQAARPYDWQILGQAGERLAYLDMRKVLLTDQLDKYIGHMVIVHGTIHPLPGTQDLVVGVESFQLK